MAQEHKKDDAIKWQVLLPTAGDHRFFYKYLPSKGIQTPHKKHPRLARAEGVWTELAIGKRTNSILALHANQLVCFHCHGCSHWCVLWTCTFKQGSSCASFCFLTEIFHGQVMLLPCASHQELEGDHYLAKQGPKEEFLSGSYMKTKRSYLSSINGYLWANGFFWSYQESLLPLRKAKKLSRGKQSSSDKNTGKFSLPVKMQLRFL